MRRLFVIATALLGCVLPGPPAQAAPTAVALWHLDEKSGTRMVDRSGHGNDGRIDKVTLGLQGFKGGAYGFDGRASLVTIPDDRSLDPGTAPITISAYLQVPSSLGLGDYNVIQKGTATARGGAYKLEIAGFAGQLGRPDCAFNGVAGKARVVGNRAISDSRWHRVQCVLTASSISLFVDGVQQQRVPNSIGSVSNSSAVTVGGKPNKTHFYRGNLDEVTITIG